MNDQTQDLDSAASALDLDSRKANLERLVLALAVFKDYVSIQNGAFLFDSNKLAEGLMRDLLSLIGPWGPMKDLNLERENQPAIDLVSIDGKVGIQVTSTSTPAKVKDTIKKFGALEEPPEELFFVMLCGRQKSYPEESIKKVVAGTALRFDPDKNILDLSGLYKMASSAPPEKLRSAVRRLEEELSSRAIKLLQRFNASADRVLQVLTAHRVSPAGMIELLDLDSKTPPELLATSETLQPLLVRDRCYESLAEAFNVPADWLRGGTVPLAQRSGPSVWRGNGSVGGLLADLLTRYNSVCFHIVLPDELRAPFLPAKPRGADEPPDLETPVLVFYEAQEWHGRVFGHLGIQPWRIAHHRKAALFLGTILRDLGLKGIASVGVRWWSWPRDRIDATVTDVLLVEAKDQHPCDLIDETDAITPVAGGWSFVYEPGLNHEFNGTYAPAVRQAVTKALEAKTRKSVIDEMGREFMAKFMLSDPEPGVARVFFNTAYDIALACGTSVSFVDEKGRVSQKSVAEAKLMMDAAPALDDHNKPVRLVFIDVRTA